MTELEQMTMLKALTGEQEEALLSPYLNIAKYKILAKAYPFNEEMQEIPNKYKTLQVEIACYLFNKRGAEGETAHSENGVSRSYENADVPSSMLARVTPYVEVL